MKNDSQIPFSKNTKLGLGTVQFGLNYGISNKQGITTHNQVQEILEFASKNKIDTLDTARLYGDSENVLGKMKIDRFKIVSKFPYVKNAYSFKEQLDITLENLKVRSIYAYIAHSPQTIIENPEIWDALLQSKEKGQIKKIGFSFNTVSEAEIILDQEFLPDLVQVPFNYFDQRFYSIMSNLKDKGCEIHSRSAFLQGLMFMKPNDLHSFFEPVFPLLEELQKHIEYLPGMLLNFCIKQKFIDKVILGVNNVAQLQNNLKLLYSYNVDLSAPKINIPDSILTPSEWPTIN